jgi:hypothetical protein
MKANYSSLMNHKHDFDNYKMKTNYYIKTMDCNYSYLNNHSTTHASAE